MNTTLQLRPLPPQVPRLMARLRSDEPVELARGAYRRAELISGMDTELWDIWEEKPALEARRVRLHADNAPPVYILAAQRPWEHQPVLEVES